MLKRIYTIISFAISEKNAMWQKRDSSYGIGIAFLFLCSKILCQNWIKKKLIKNNSNTDFYFGV